MTGPTRRAEEAAADMAADCLAMRSRLIGRTVTAAQHREVDDEPQRGAHEAERLVGDPFR